MIEWILGLTVLNTVLIIYWRIDNTEKARGVAKIYDQQFKILNDRTQWMIDHWDKED